MPVGMYIGMITRLCMYGPSWVSMHHLTPMSDTGTILPFCNPCCESYSIHILEST
jgi:hypothetical protein